MIAEGTERVITIGGIDDIRVTRVRDTVVREVEIRALGVVGARLRLVFADAGARELLALLKPHVAQ